MYVIDRIEEGIAVVYDENQNKIEINKTEITGNVKDGAIIKFENGKWSVDDAKTEGKKADLKKRLNNLFNK